MRERRSSSLRRPTRLTLRSGLVVAVLDSRPVTTGARHEPQPSAAVLLIHGIGMTSASLDPVARALARTHRAVLLTLPGHGGSPRPRRALSVEGYADSAGEAVDRLGLGRVIVVGQSMGTQVAVALARRRPDLVEGLVLIGPVVDPARPSAIEQGLALALDSTRETARGNLVVMRDYVRCGPRWYAPTLRAMLAFPMLEAASTVTVPTIVVRGARDPIADAAWVERLAAVMPDARVATLSGAHHTQLVVPRDVADLVRNLDGRSDSPRQGPARRASTENDGFVTIHE